MSTGFDDSDELLAAYLAESGESDLGEEVPPRVWEDGREVGEWTVTGFLARGGSAEVYCAKHRRLGTHAALKVLWRDGAGPRERFDRESRFLMGNPGPSFPAFYGAGVEDGRPWVAMELLDEFPLPLSDREVARYLLDVGEGVDALHARGWLHRDIKPGNILRRADRHAVLADFGLLKAVGTGDAPADAATERESPSVVDGREAGVGTPGHSAPEQFAGGGATPAADVYALGMLAEECFDGHPPRVWEKIIRRATAALPRQRYSSVEPMLRAIRQRHLARNGTWVLLVFVLAAALGVWGWGERKENAPQGMEPTPGTAEMSVATVEPEMPAPPETPVISLEPETPAEPETLEPPAVIVTPAAVPTTGVRMAGVRAEREAALVRFESEEWRKEAVLALVTDMQKITPKRTRWFRGPCWVGLHEVTQRQWMALMDDNPSRFQGDDLPVDSLTVEACLEFLERLNATSIAKEKDLKFRLPEAWEWHDLAGDVSPGERLANGWFAENSGGRTHPVGEKAESGCCADLYGNVRELTSAWGVVDGKKGLACMGGSWADSAEGESLPVAVLEHPLFDLSNHAASDDAPVSGDTPSAVCPAPGEIGFRLWADPRTPPANRLDGAAQQAREYWEGKE